jgi:DNA repair protein endonuclease SAE2/CtIP C-terminus
VAPRLCQRRGVKGMVQLCSSDPLLASGPNRRDNDIAQHKRDISRHRHNWERANTPPGYWNIGFPSTQEAFDINEKAKEMHRQKLLMVEQEAK